MLKNRQKTANPAELVFEAKTIIAFFCLFFKNFKNFRILSGSMDNIVGSTAQQLYHHRLLAAATIGDPNCIQQLRETWNPSRNKPQLVHLQEAAEKRSPGISKFKSAQIAYDWLRNNPPMTLTTMRVVNMEGVHLMSPLNGMVLFRSPLSLMYLKFMFVVFFSSYI